MSLREAEKQLKTNRMFLHGCAIGMGIKPERVGRSFAITCNEFERIRLQIETFGGITPQRRKKPTRKPRQAASAN